MASYVVDGFWAASLAGTRVAYDRCVVVRQASCRSEAAKFVRRDRPGRRNRDNKENGAIEGISMMSIALTLDFERTPPLESIQMYSAIAVPFWFNFMYLSNCCDVESAFCCGLKCCRAPTGWLQSSRNINIRLRYMKLESPVNLRINYCACNVG